MISAAKPPLSPTCSTGPNERSEPAHHLRASLVNIVATEPKRERLHVQPAVRQFHDPPCPPHRGASSARRLRSQGGALVNELIGRVADKWTMIILEVLSERDVLRFTQLARQVPGISQKILTQTLRASPDPLNRIPRRLSGLLPGLVLCNFCARGVTEGGRSPTGDTSRARLRNSMPPPRGAMA